MSEKYQHLQIEKEPLINERRTRQYKIPKTPRGDLAAHGQRLGTELTGALRAARKESASNANRFVLKLHYTGIVDFKNIHKHGIEFVSHEDNHVFIAFANEQGLSEFAEHLSRLGLEDADLSYRQILEALDGIDNWTRSDRESWAIRQYGLPKDANFRLDVELWPIETQHHPVRLQLIKEFEKWLADNKIQQIDRINLDSLLLYRIEVNNTQANLIFEQRDIRIVDLPPKTGIGFNQLNVDIEKLPRRLPSPSASSARVCILDSGITSNHPLLNTAIAEAASFIQGQDENDDAGHGTAVAGIALYGDVEACAASSYWKPELWIYSGKILCLDKKSNEVRFDEKTIEKTLEEAVAYFAGEQGCRIFNLSIGNTNSPYDNRHIRGMAYVLDRLAREYDVLFVVSAGNFSGSSDPAIPKNSWRDEYPEYLLAPESVIIDPAPALNVLTVGSVARHDAHINEQRHPEIYALSPAAENQPSPFTRHGPSVKGALKPDLVSIGGNLASPMRNEGQQWKQDARGMGVLTCNSAFVGNTIFKEISGTSFAAPYITHLAGRLLNEYPDASANMLRALLVNHANLPAECESTFDEEQRNQYRKEKHRELPREVVGYGMIDTDTLYRSTESAVVLMCEDGIENDAHQFYELPLPNNFLRSNRSTRELRVTLAFCPPVRTTRLEYVATRIFFRLVKGKSLAEVQQYFNHDTQKETETRNDDAATNRTVSSQLRDRGTVQASTWRFRQLSPETKWFVVVTRQDKDWGTPMCLEEERYALVVTVTDRENEEAELYTQIESRIRAQQQARERARATR
ncbi:S8 family peptidase [Burkholderia cepacia]|uniref:S8 family peptidase n=1 Tax=Burkholderia cepacia TaxID=292 RepID=UPI001CF518FD|nr:S8 family peptidase [Burkholderia cepacia]MCA8137821.1 S8 family peptidase [Burkholderia cepacia]